MNKRIILVFLGILLGVSTNAQTKTNRVLIILDASGSMAGQYGGSIKIQSAKKILKLISDSLGTRNDTEVALRVFGHQYDKKDSNCTDSKLEIGFVKSKLFNTNPLFQKLKPQGMSPLAYSLQQAAIDFPKNGNNSIIIITDGIENCNGDPCDASIMLQNKGIAIRPYIIGLGLLTDNLKVLECVGQVFNANKEDVALQVTKILVNGIMYPTTLQVQMLNQLGKPTVTGPMMSLKDAYRGQYNVFHTMNIINTPDTLNVLASEAYTLKIHTLPPVYSQPFSVKAKKHNVTNANVPLGSLKTVITGTYKYDNPRCMVKDTKKNLSTVHNQSLNSSQSYIVGDYEVELLTLPRIKRTETIAQSKTNTITIPMPGQLNYTATVPGTMVVFWMNEKGVLEEIYSSDNQKGSITIQPNNYTLLFRPKNTFSTSSSSTLNVAIQPNIPLSVKF